MTQENVLQDLYSRARAKCLKGQTDEGLKLFEELEAKCEDSKAKATVIGMKGTAMMLAGKVDQAIKYFEQSLDELDLDNVRYNLLCAYAQQRKYGLALQLGETFEVHEPSYCKAMKELGMIFLQLNKFEEAIKLFARSIKSGDPIVQIESLIGKGRCLTFTLRSAEDVKEVNVLFAHIKLRIEENNYVNTETEAEYLHTYGDFCTAKQDFEAAKESYAQSVSLYRELGKDKVGLLIAKKLAFCLKTEAGLVNNPELKAAAEKFDNKLDEEMSNKMPWIVKEIEEMQQKAGVQKKQ